jgi:hypothetical protein
MARSNRFLAVMACALMFAGCSVSVANQGVGDPCAPAQPAASPGGPTCGDAGCFISSEVYLETASLQCRTHVCVAYHWDQATGASQNEHAFCTCRCGGSAGESQCACPDGFECTTLFAGAGNPEVQGAYCIRTGLARMH